MKNLSPQNRDVAVAEERIGEQIFRVSDHHVLKNSSLITALRQVQREQKPVL
jgi:hypothetical protein